MYCTPKRIKKQLERTDKLIRIIWRLYSPYKSHRKCIVKASYKLLEAIEQLEELYKLVLEDYKKELENPLSKKSIPPGYYQK
jgi:division protein CdvB (Snf7/Vps24/ESCRT-III family)